MNTTARLPASALPVSNRPATVIGIDIAITVLAACAVVLRLIARVKLHHGLGWDDAFIVLAIGVVLSGTVATAIGPRYGLGQPITSLTNDDIEGYFHMFYIMNASYVLDTALIKISLLFQYLRLFPNGLERRVSQVLLVVLFLWGFAYSFMAWVPCFPVDRYWLFFLPDHNQKCYGFGILEQRPFAASYESQAATNMSLDLIVFSIPVVLVWRKGSVSSRQRLGSIFIFILGLSVIAVAIARLVFMVRYQPGTHLDWTYNSPNIVICSILELGLAFITASTPIFWPVIQASLGGVFVTHEIRVEEERCVASEDVLEMDSAALASCGDSDVELNRRNSGGGFNESFLYLPNKNRDLSVHIEAQARKGKH